MKITNAIGLCPYCKELLTGKDIKDTKFRGIGHEHFAYTCQKCGHIIGLGVAY